MGTRKQREKQEDIWIAHTELASAPGHPFYQRLNELLEAEGFDEFVEGRCAKFYAAKYGRPSLTPGIYFRSLLIGYFEGIDSERGIAWRLADSLALRRFVGIALDEYTPDHSTISRFISLSSLLLPEHHLNDFVVAFAFRFHHCVAVDVHSGGDPRVPHKLLLHADRSANQL